ncbi:Protein of unknown function [Allochromatium warmingii]|uniref:DUF3593 domain-containing protein n=1 Tax=Allochromatium warmingii TaxID=61595 RepID=A0A1H3AUI0_ALLWA|nr:DUF2499 domain-containing protein [Allochromatium warmingii]SDX32784.1 Protein of unknown function [Allochromatium warmingii]
MNTLLSGPTWIIHLLTVSEWAIAMGIFWRYGQVLQRAELQIFALCMGPHLLSGLLILGFHFSGDTMRSLLELSRLTNCIGSLLLLAATATLLPALRAWRRWIWASMPLVLIAIGWAQWPLFGTHSAALLQAANSAYLLFLLMLLWVYRAEPVLFSPLTLGGFWFLLVFVAVTIVTTRFATVELGLPSLAHADWLHGLSESLLSIANLCVAIGGYRRLKQAQGNELVRSRNDCSNLFQNPG